MTIFINDVWSTPNTLKLRCGTISQKRAWHSLGTARSLVLQVKSSARRSRVER